MTMASSGGNDGDALASRKDSSIATTKVTTLVNHSNDNDNKKNEHPLELSPEQLTLRERKLVRVPLNLS